RFSRDWSSDVCSSDLDLADNALNVLVQNTVGAGIDVLAAPRLPGQPINRELAEQIDDLWDSWWDAPEATGLHDYGACQQLLARHIGRAACRREGAGQS